MRKGLLIPDVGAGFMVLYDESTVAPQQKQVSFLGSKVTVLNISQIATEQFRVGKEQEATAKSYNKNSI